MDILLEDLNFVKENTQTFSKGWGIKLFYRATGTFFTYTVESSRFISQKERAQVIFRLYANSETARHYNLNEGELVSEFKCRFIYGMEIENYRRQQVDKSPFQDNHKKLEDHIISQFRGCLEQETVTVGKVEELDVLSTANFTFMLKNLRPNKDTDIWAKVYHAHTEQHFISAEVTRNIVSFVLYEKNGRDLRNPLHSFTYDRTKQKFSHSKKEAGTRPYSWSKKQVIDFERHVVNRLTRSLEIEAARPRYEIETEKPITPSPPVKLKEESLLTLERVKMTAKIAESKEIILRSVYQLNSMERIKFVKMWEEYEELLTSSENLVAEFSSTSDKSVGSRLQSIHDRLSKMAAKVLYKKHKPKATKDMQVLIHEIKQLGEQVQSNLADSDIVANHQCRTILSDTKKLVELFEKSESEDRTRLARLVMEGLTEAVQKLQVLVTESQKKEERIIERQVLLLKQR